MCYYFGTAFTGSLESWYGQYLTVCYWMKVFYRVFCTLILRQCLFGLYWHLKIFLNLDAVSVSCVIHLNIYRGAGILTLAEVKCSWHLVPEPCYWNCVLCHWLKDVTFRGPRILSWTVFAVIEEYCQWQGFLQINTATVSFVINFTWHLQGLLNCVLCF